MSGLRVAMFPFGDGDKQNPYQANLAAALERTGVSVTRVPKRRRFGGLRDLLAEDVDLVHFDWLDGLYRGRSRPATVAKIGALLRDLRRLDVPATWTIHNIRPHEPPAWPRLDSWIERRVATSMDGFVHFSDDASRTWGARHPYAAGRPWTKIRAGHYIDNYPNVVDQGEARRVLQLPQDAAIGLCFGSIRPYKGFLRFARAFLGAAVPEAMLVIAGPPHDAGEVHALQALARSHPDRLRVDAHWVADPDVQNYMNAAEVGFAPFESINNSGTVTLMQSFGLPIVAPDLGPIRDLACPANTYFVEQVDSTQIRQGLNFADTRRTHRQLTIEWVRHHQSWDATASALASHYVELRGRRPSRATAPCAAPISSTAR